jgi:hypothetical protein
MVVALIVGIVLLALGAYCAIKPDNALLPYAHYYYNPKKPFKPIALSGGLGAKHVKEFGKTSGILLYMRLFGTAAAIVGLVFIASYFKII